MIAVGSRIAGSAMLDEMGWCALSDTPDRHVIGMPVSIIQHPRWLAQDRCLQQQHAHLSYRPRAAL